MSHRTASTTEVRPTGDRALNVTEACDYLGLRKTALYDRIQRNEIPHERYGRRIVLRQSDLDRYRVAHRFGEPAGCKE